MEILGNVTTEAGVKIVIANYLSIKDVTNCKGVECKFSDALGLTANASYVLNVTARGASSTRPSFGVEFKVTKITHGYVCNVTSTNHLSYFKEIANVVKQPPSELVNVQVLLGVLGGNYTFRIVF